MSKVYESCVAEYSAVGCTIDNADDASNSVYDGYDTGGNPGAGRDFILAL